MAICPECDARVTDEFGLINCHQCGAALFIEIDGKVKSYGLTEEKASKTGPMGLSDHLPSAKPQSQSNEVMPSAESLSGLSSDKINALTSDPTDKVAHSPTGSHDPTDRIPTPPNAGNEGGVFQATQNISAGTRTRPITNAYPEPPPDREEAPADPPNEVDIGDIDGNIEMTDDFFAAEKVSSVQEPNDDDVQMDMSSAAGFEIEAGGKVYTEEAVAGVPDQSLEAEMGEPLESHDSVPAVASEDPLPERNTDLVQNESEEHRAYNMNDLELESFEDPMRIREQQMNMEERQDPPSQIDIAQEEEEGGADHFSQVQSVDALSKTPEEEPEEQVSESQESEVQLEEYHPEDESFEDDSDEEEYYEVDIKQKPVEDMSEISDYGNSEVSQGREGSLLYTVEITGIDTKDLRKAVRDTLSDRKLLWDSDQLMRSIRNGTLRISNVSPVKAFVVIDRLKGLPLEVSWEQNVLNQL